MKVKSEREVAQSCPTLSNPMDYSPPGSPVPGILQARALEWVPLPSLKSPAEGGKTYTCVEGRSGVRAQRAKGREVVNKGMPIVPLPLVSPEKL